MKILLLGCGIQGRAAAYDLVQSSRVESVVLAEGDRNRLKDVLAWLKSPKAEPRQLDVRDGAVLRENMAGCDAVLNSAPYAFCLPVTEAAIDCGVPLVDLGGDTDVVLKQLRLSPLAKKKGITIVPDCGVSPGITNAMVGHAMEQIDSAEEVWVRDGGLPQSPKPPLHYSLLFSIDVLLNEYTGKTTAVRDFRTVEVEALSELEPLELPEPVGRCEAAHGMGMLSTLPWTYHGRIRNMDNKFVRYPGHIPFFQTLRALGFLDEAPLEDIPVPPRAIVRSLLETHLNRPAERDLYVIEIRMEGKRQGQPVRLRYSLLDFFDERTGLTAMSRTTGFTASIVAQMLAAGEITEKGVLPPELALPKEKFFDELRRRGIQLTIGA